MPLVEIELELPEAVVTAEAERLFAAAEECFAHYENQAEAAIPGFVPSDFRSVYRALVEVDSRRLAAGQRFLEWGSGLGVVTCLAASLGFDAMGIEIEQRLVEIAESMAQRNGAHVQFACGSFVPPGAEPQLDSPRDISWLATLGPDGYEELELDPDDFDFIFAYPWPGEEQVIFDLFAQYASVGALLLTYHGQEGLRLNRKTNR